MKTTTGDSKFWRTITAAFSLTTFTSLIACQTLNRTFEQMKPRDPRVVSSEIFEFPKPAEGIFGGFSGLWFEGRDPKTGNLTFTTTTDRGPNLDSKVDPDRNNQTVRPFVDPKFRVQWIRFSLDPAARKLIPTERVELALANGRAISGLPNLTPGVGDIPAGYEEIAVDLKGQTLAPDPMGLDTESIARDRDGTYWMGEEYRPSLLHFTAQGRLLSRWVPEGTDKKYGQPVLAKHLLKRRLNRGFEGIAIEGNSVFAFLQSGLQGEPDITRIEQVDKTSGQPIATLIYPFESTPTGWSKIDKIGDAVAIGPNEFYVIEQNGSTKEDAFRRIYKIDIRGASNLLRSPERLVSARDLCEGERKTEGAENCLLPVRKTLVADLTELGLRDADKVEGLALIDDKTLAVVNDNDFTARPTRLVIIHLPTQP